MRNSRIKKVICLVMIVCLLSVFSFYEPRNDEAVAQDYQQSSYTPRTVYVRVNMDDAFRTEYTAYTSTAQQFFNSAKYAFSAKWDLTLTPTYYAYYIPSSFYILECQRAYNSQCQFGQCGINCYNTTTHYGHHKNAYKYFAELKNNIGLGSFDIILTITSYSTCYMSGSSHYGGPWGLADINGDYALTYAAQDMGGYNYAQVHNIQHELSHIFGCHDGVCSRDELCIMSGGFKNTDTSAEDNIWCSNCQADFNRNN